jgi:hypothetical protein
VRSRPVDPVSLVAGIGLVLFAIFLSLDELDALEFGFGWLGAAVAALAGAILLVSGLDD